jgi:N-acetylglucosaminyldiphosphoundecaprenol N-acetyl-beta-D-mannosaminyltransferase
VKSVDFFGVPVTDEPRAALEMHLVERLGQGRTTTVMSMNLTSMRSLGRRMIAHLHAFDIVTADGNGLVKLSGMLRRRIHHQVAICDLSDGLLALAHSRRLTVFLLGARAEVNRRAIATARRRHPGLRIVGRDGYFTAEGEEPVLEEVRTARPGIVLVGMSSPRKEDVIRHLAPRLDAAILVACGGYIDILGGRTRRAPLFVQKASLEWLFRFVQEPRRLLGPMLGGALHFLLLSFPRLMVNSWLRARPRTLDDIFG